MSTGLSPEHCVSVAEPSDTQMSSETNSSECPDELYNLTKLAEVAVATGQILEQRRLHSPTSTVNESSSFTYTHKLFDKSSRNPRPHLIKVRLHHPFTYMTCVHSNFSINNTNINLIFLFQLD